MKLLKNKDYHFLVYKKWSPIEDRLNASPKKEKDEESDEYTEVETMLQDFPDPVRTEYEIHMEQLRLFTEENNFWDIYTLFPLTEDFLNRLRDQPGIEIIAVPFTTAYRTRISIARLFKSDVVKNDVIKLAEEWVNSSPELVQRIKKYTNPISNKNGV